MIRRLPLLAMCLISVAAAGTAEAAPDAAPAASTTPATVASAQPRQWYGWQIMLVDVVGLGAMTGGAIPLTKSNSGIGAGFFYGGFVVSNFAGPFVHIAHLHGKDVTRVPISYAIRVGGAVLGLLAGYGIASTGTCDRTQPVNRCITGMVWGTVVGSLIAAALDDSLLAWDRAPASAARTSRGSVLTWEPGVSPIRGGAVVGLTGAF